MDAMIITREMLEEERQRQKEREEYEKSLWAHDPNTGERTFYLYGLTDEIPDVCTMATKREAAPITDDRIKQIFIPEELLKIGATTMEYKGYSLPIKEKTVDAALKDWRRDIEGNCHILPS